jgi:hypothetical protein
MYGNPYGGRMLGGPYGGPSGIASICYLLAILE